jgi:uncharacterized protein with FMN-binding domain
MRRIVIALGATLSGLVLLFSWPTSLNHTVNQAAGTGTAGKDTGDTGAASTDTSASGTSGDSAAKSSSATYTGTAADTRYGPVQVEVTVANGVLVSATAIDFPTRDRHDQQINSYAIPILQSETVDAQSSAIDMVSGATVTSRAYIQSLQDALDQAGL